MEWFHFTGTGPFHSCVWYKQKSETGRFRSCVWLERWNEKWNHIKFKILAAFHLYFEEKQHNSIYIDKNHTYMTSIKHKFQQKVPTSSITPKSNQVHYIYTCQVIILSHTTISKYWLLCCVVHVANNKPEK